MTDHVDAHARSSTASSTAAACTGHAKGGTEVTFGEYGIQALEPGWITARQIEAARIAMTRHIKRGGKVWINVFPDKPVTEKPAETRMGSGKGNPERWVAVVKPGRVLFELVVPRPGDRPGGHRAGHPEAADQGPLRHPRGGVLMAKHDHEFRDLDDAELVERLGEAKEELFNLRFQHATGQLDNTAALGAAAQATSPASTPSCATARSPPPRRSPQEENADG